MVDELRLHPAHPVPLLRPDPPAGPYAQSRRVDGFTVIEFHGEIDLAADAQVRAHVDAATMIDRPRVVIDLRPASFIDCSALRVLCHARRQALKKHGGMGLVCTSPHHLGIISVARLTDLLGPVATLEAACTAALRGTPPHPA